MLFYSHVIDAGALLTVNFHVILSQITKLCVLQRLFAAASAPNSSELWTIKVRSVQALLQPRTLGLCSQPIAMFSLSAERGQHPEGADLKVQVMEWRRTVGFVQGRTDFIVFHSKLLIWTNVFCIIWAQRRLAGCVCVCGVCTKCTDGCDGYNPPDQKTWNPVTWTSTGPFSRWSTCWDPQMEKERKRWIDQVRLITPAVPDFNKKNHKKKKNGLIHLAGLLFLIESNYFISVVDIISWRWRPLGFLRLWHLYRSVTLLHVREAFESTHGKFSEALLTHGIEHLLGPSDQIAQLNKRNKEKSTKWNFDSTSDLTDVDSKWKKEAQRNTF